MILLLYRSMVSAVCYELLLPVFYRASRPFCETCFIVHPGIRFSCVSMYTLSTMGTMLRHR
jgi:hypothetical protein